MRNTPGISEEDYQELNRGWLEDLERPGAHTVSLRIEEHRELMAHRARSSGTTGHIRYEICGG